MALLYCTRQLCFTGLDLGFRPANERRRYFVTTSLVGWWKPRISPALHKPLKGIGIKCIGSYHYEKKNLQITKKSTGCWDIMAAILQKTFSNAFSWIKSTVSEFHLNMFPGVHLSPCQHWFRWWLGTKQVYISEGQLFKIFYVNFFHVPKHTVHQMIG